MFITNLTKDRLGINGIINLRPYEVNKYINDKDKDLVARVVQLEAAKLISVVRHSGLTKVGIPGKVVKTMGADIHALTTAPRSEGVNLTVAKAPAKEEIAADVVPDEPTNKDVVQEEAVAEDSVAEEAVTEEAVAEKVAKPQPVAEKTSRRSSSRKTKLTEAVAKATE